VFHLVKQPRYYAAVDEIREPHTGNGHGGGTYGGAGNSSGNGVTHRTFLPRPHEFNALGKLPGSVWSIPSQPLTVPARLGIDHFAAFPVELPRRIIAGWSPPGICVACGEGRRPVTHVERIPLRPGDRPGVAGLNGDWMHGFDRRAGTHMLSQNTITGYACACPAPDAPTRPAVILDPFAGTGTTLLAAEALGRTGVGVDLSHDYCRLARWRVNDPGERAKAWQVPKPPPVADGQEALFTL
jgi:DNA methylase